MSIAATATAAVGVEASYLPFIFFLNNNNFPQNSQFRNTITSFESELRKAAEEWSGD